MNNQPLTWLEFLSYENRIKALLRIIKNHVVGTKIKVYSLSDNTLVGYWVKYDSESILEDIYADNELLFVARIGFVSKHLEINHHLKDSYLKLELLSTGEIHLTGFLILNQNIHTAGMMNPQMEMLEEFSQIDATIPMEERSKLFTAIRDTFNILCETVSKTYNPKRASVNEERMSRIKMCFASKK